MNAFLRSHRILAIKKEFVPDGENSFWTFCVEFLDSPGNVASAVGSGGKAPKVDYKEILSESEFALFSKLRDCRKELAEKDGVPVYVVFTNEQLAQIVQKKVTTREGLGEIDGVGESRIGKYGAPVLNVLSPEAR